MADDDVKRLVFSIMKFLNKQKGNNQGEVLEQIEVAQQVSHETMNLPRYFDIVVYTAIILISNTVHIF